MSDQVETSPASGVASSRVPPRGPGPEAASGGSLRRRHRWRSLPWAGFILEIASIVASVLVALWVSNWSEQRKDEARARQALVGIRRELDDNRGRLAETRDYYRELVATLDALHARAPGSSLAGLHQIPGWQGLRTPLLNESVFSAALSTQALAPIDFDLVARLSQVYGALRQYGWLQERLLTDIYEQRIQVPEPLRGRMKELLLNVTEVERVVAQMVRRLDTTLGGPPAASTAR